MSNINSISAKQSIQTAVEKVAQTRRTAEQTAGLALAVSRIKALQSQRFMGAYADLLKTPQFKPATQFFLEELYSEKDYSQRDAQFSRIAGTLERLFPKQVVHTAVALAQLHSLTEDLDLAMAQSWLNLQPSITTAVTDATDNTVDAENTDELDRYIAAWQTVGRRADRDAQLTGALVVGQELVTLTRTPGLRMALKMMRKPAQLAGMAALQHFLETGFDTFAGMKDGAEFFLQTVKKRESDLINALFDDDASDNRIALFNTLKNNKNRF